MQPIQRATYKVKHMVKAQPATGHAYHMFDTIGATFLKSASTIYWHKSVGGRRQASAVSLPFQQWKQRGWLPCGAPQHTHPYGSGRGSRRRQSRQASGDEQVGPVSTQQLIRHDETKFTGKNERLPPKRERVNTNGWGCRTKMITMTMAIDDDNDDDEQKHHEEDKAEAADDDDDDNEDNDDEWRQWWRWWRW